MKVSPYIKIILLLAAVYSFQGCYEATGRRDTMPLKYASSVDITESRPDLIQSRLDSLLAFMIRNEIVEIQLIKNNLRFEVVMQGMKAESEMNHVKFNKLLEDIELRNSTFYTSFKGYYPEKETGLGAFESDFNNEKDVFVISIKASIDKKEDINNSY